MKIQHFLFALLCSLSLLVSCGEKEQGNEGTKDATVSVSPTELTFSSDVSTQTVTVTASGKWYLDSSQTWCQTSVTSGNGNGEVKVTVSANPNSTARTATISFTTDGTATASVSVSQKGPETASITVDPDKWDGKKRAEISYQLLIYSFADSNGDGIGDFKGIENKLDYLDELGVSAIWLSPAHPAEAYHGYGVKDYDALNPDYGTEEDFKSLIDAAHSHDIKIYMDYVINHTAKDHPWFQNAISSETSEYRDWYVLSEDPVADIAAGKIPMISTEGASGYDSGQWFSAVAGEASSQKIKFTLDWTKSSAPTLTAEQVETVSNSGAQTSGKYLYYGDGSCVQFYTTEKTNIYSLSIDIKSSWGVLVRTSTTSWDGGTKYGAPGSNRQLEWGKALTLSNSDAQDILLPGMKSLMYHSHFWTSAFADLNYGYADKCADSPAFKGIVKSAEKWIDLGVDGFRLDGAKHVYHNASSDENPTFWNTFYTTLNDYFHKSHSGDIYMVGEVFDDYEAAAPYYKGFPAIFDFGFWYRLKWSIQNSTGCYLLGDLLKQQKLYASYRPSFIDATKLTNHDETRAGTDLNGNTNMMKMAGAILLTSSGSPYIYYGEELGYLGDKSGGDEYVRNPMKWGDNATTTFMKKVSSDMSKVKDVATQSQDASSMLSDYRSFAQLRNTYPALATGTMSEHPTYNSNNTQYKSIAAWYMTEGNQKMLVVHNLSNTAATVNLNDSIDKAVAVLGEVTGSTTNGVTSARLGAWSSIVFLLK